MVEKKKHTHSVKLIVLMEKAIVIDSTEARGGRDSTMRSMIAFESRVD